jgi:hypothetical protein
MLTLDQATQKQLEEFRTSLPSLPNEASKVKAFMMLVGQLFPGSGIVARLAQGSRRPSGSRQECGGSTATSAMP